MASQSHADPLLGNRSPDEEDDEMDIEGEHGSASLRARKRIRGTRACDRCRRSKSRCDAPADGSHPCSNCRSAKLECTMDTPTRKRGPPKGYLHNVESRLHSLQAILGAMLAHPDLTVRAACERISRDPTAEDIISSVQSGPFGPTPRASTSPGEAGPSTKDTIRAWQDRLFGLLQDGAQLPPPPPDAHQSAPMQQSTSISTLASTSRQLAPSPPPLNATRPLLPPEGSQPPGPPTNTTTPSTTLSPMSGTSPAPRPHAIQSHPP